MRPPDGAAELSRDAFLGGRLHLWQPRVGYRAGVDPVLLAASVPAKPGQTVLELGCGVGAAILSLGTRVDGLRLSGIELQANYADLARRNADAAGLPLDVVTGDLAQMPAGLKSRRFDHVIANPPYFDRRAGHAARDAGRETALGEATPLSLWIDAAARRTAPGGYLHVIHRAERLPELLSLSIPRFGSIEILPLIPRPGRAAQLIVMRARRGGRAAFRLHDGWVLHRGATHEADAENYTDRTASILRDAATLPFAT